MTKRRWILVCLGVLSISAFALSTTLTGCNTMEGAGQDIQEGGEAIEDAAD